MTDPKRKIIYLVTKGNFGGAQRYVYELASSLPKSQFEVLVALGEGKKLEEKLKEKGIRVYRLQSLARNINLRQDWQAFWEIYHLFKKERPDIVHLNSSKAGLGALAARIAGVKKIIFTGHGWAFNESRPWWQKKILGFIYWLTIILCHQTILVAESIKRQVADWPEIENKTIVIHNGLMTAELLDRAEAREALLPEKKNKFWIGTVSELHPNKGLDFLIEAFSQVVRSMLSSSLGWSLILVIIGDGQEREKLENLIKAKKLEDRVFLLGYVDNARKYLKAFDIFTLTSRTEALPYALLEAGQAGIAVLASEVGGLPEIIPEAEFGILVSPGNITELAKSLKYLINKELFREEVGHNLKRRVLSEFTFRSMLEKTIEIYKK